MAAGSYPAWPDFTVRVPDRLRAVAENGPLCNPPRLFEYYPGFFELVAEAARTRRPGSSFSMYQLLSPGIAGERQIFCREAEKI